MRKSTWLFVTSPFQKSDPLSAAGNAVRISAAKQLTKTSRGSLRHLSKKEKGKRKKEKGKRGKRGKKEKGKERQQRASFCFFFLGKGVTEAGLIWAESLAAMAFSTRCWWPRFATNKHRKTTFSPFYTFILSSLPSYPILSHPIPVFLLFFFLPATWAFFEKTKQLVLHFFTSSGSETRCWTFNAKGMVCELL